MLHPSLVGSYIRSLPGKKEREGDEIQPCKFDSHFLSCKKLHRLMVKLRIFYKQ